MSFVNADSVLYPVHRYIGFSDGVMLLVVKIITVEVHKSVTFISLRRPGNFVLLMSENCGQQHAVRERRSLPPCVDTNNKRQPPPEPHASLMFQRRPLQTLSEIFRKRMRATMDWNTSCRRGATTTPTITPSCNAV